MQHKRRKLTVFLNGNLNWNFIQDNRISWKQETKFMLENIPHHFVTTKQFYRFSSLLFLTARTGDFFVFDSSCYATITETSLSNNVYIKNFHSNTLSFQMQKQKAHSVTIGAKEFPVFSFVNMRARWQKFLVAELKWNIWKKTRSVTGYMTAGLIRKPTHILESITHLEKKEENRFQ